MTLGIGWPSGESRAPEYCRAILLSCVVLKKPHSANPRHPLSYKYGSLSHTDAAVRAQARRDGLNPPATTPAAGNQSSTGAIGGAGGGNGVSLSDAAIGMYVAIAAAGFAAVLLCVTCILYQMGFLVRKPVVQSPCLRTRARARTNARTGTHPLARART